MKLAFCVACGVTDNLHHHHLVPRVKGGSDEESNLITLCADCHFRLHERRGSDGYNHRHLTKVGLQAAKDRGVVLGNAKLASDNAAAARARDAELEPILREMSDLSSRDVAAELEKRGVKVSHLTVQRMRQRLGLT